MYSKKGEKNRVDMGSFGALLCVPVSAVAPMYLYGGWTHACINKIVHFIAILSNYSGLCVYGSFQLCKLSSEFALFVVLIKNLNSHFLCV